LKTLLKKTIHHGHFISSDLLTIQRLDEDSLQWIRAGPKDYSPWASYSNSKLCTLLSSLAMTQKISSNNSDSTVQPNVTINTVTPGIVYTDLGRWAPYWQRFLGAPLMHTFLRTPKEGAASVIHTGYGSF